MSENNKSHNCIGHSHNCIGHSHNCIGCSNNKFDDETASKIIGVSNEPPTSSDEVLKENIKFFNTKQLIRVFYYHFEHNFSDIRRLSSLFGLVFTLVVRCDVFWVDFFKVLKTHIVNPANKGSITQVFITIIRSKLFQGYLTRNKNEAFVVDYLWGIASKIPHGIYQLGILRNKHKIPERIVDNIVIKELDILSNILLYGHKKDLYFLIRRPDLLIKLQPSQVLPIVSRNNCDKVIGSFIYLYETIWMILSYFPPEIAVEIWGNLIYKDIFSDDVIKDLKNYATMKALKKLNKKFGLLLKKKNNFHVFSADLPVHACPKVLFHYTMGKCYVTPKADGIAYFCKFLPDSINSNPIFPPKPLYRISAEQLEMADKTVFIVYDIDVPGYWMERMNHLKKYHNGMTFEELLESDHKVVWWPKPIKPMNNHLETLKLISQPPVTPFPNDGWIIASEKYGTIKVKPKEHLTIDVLPDLKWVDQLDCSKIYRHYWIVDSDGKGEWVPRDLRQDKKNANPYNVVQDITLFHNYPWTPAQLIPFVGKRPYYSTSNVERSPKIVESLKKQKELRKKFFENCELSVGSGFMRSIYDVDIDPYIKTDDEFNPMWMDGLTLTNPVSGEPMLDVLHSVINLGFSFSLHYLWETRENINKFFNVYSNVPAILVSIVDLDQLKFENGVHTFIDGSTIKISDPFYNAYKHIYDVESVFVKSLLKWNDPENEKTEMVLSSRMVKKEFEYRGYILLEEVKGELCTVFLKFKKNK